MKQTRSHHGDVAGHWKYNLSLLSLRTQLGRQKQHIQTATIKMLMCPVSSRVRGMDLQGDHTELGCSLKSVLHSVLELGLVTALKSTKNVGGIPI